MNKHDLFCKKVGIKKKTKNPPERWFHRILGIKQKPIDLEAWDPMEPVNGGFYEEVLNAYESKTRLYQFIMTVIHILQLLQIVFGATATAISASKVPTTVVTVLTAIVTVVAGILVFTIGHLQDIRQTRNNFRKVCDYIKFKEMEYREPAQCSKDLKEAKDRVAGEKEPTVKVNEVVPEVNEVKDSKAEVKEAKDPMAEVDKAMAKVKDLYYIAVGGNNKTKSDGVEKGRLLSSK